jgi:hypothetical protein
VDYVLLILFKVMKVDPLDLDRALDTHSDAILDHQLPKPLPVDRNNFLRYLFREFRGFRIKRTCSNGHLGAPEGEAGPEKVRGPASIGRPIDREEAAIVNA